MRARLSVRNVILMVFAVGALLPARAVAQERLWVDVNVGVAIPTDRELTTSSTPTIFAEPADFSVDYSAPPNFTFDAGAGFLLTTQLGVGVSVQSSKHSDFPVLHASIPHPALANTYGSDDAEGDTELERTETSLHIQAMYVPFESDTQRFRIFGGPTYMRVENETVATIAYTQSFSTNPPSNVVDITTYEVNDCSCSGWGFHIGGDYTYFFSPNVGVGGIVRYSRVKVNPIDYSGQFELTAGGIALGGGLRVRF